LPSGLAQCDWTNNISKSKLYKQLFSQEIALTIICLYVTKTLVLYRVAELIHAAKGIIKPDIRLARGCQAFFIKYFLTIICIYRIYYISLIHQLNETDMKALNAIIATISRLEEKQWDGTITFEEQVQLLKLIEMAESMIKDV